MAKKINEARTMNVVLEDIKVNVDKLNAAKSEDKADIEVKIVELEKEYNELSLLNSWGEFVAAEIPMVAFAKAYTYPVIGHKIVPHRETVNGVKVVTHTCVIDTTKTRLLNVAEFVAWTEERGASVAHDTNWRGALNDASDSIIAQWKGFFAAKGDTRKVSIAKMKKALQDMVDALVFIPTESGRNAVLVKSDIAKAAFAFANSRKDGLQGNVLPGSIWKKLQMDVLHAVVEGKEYTITYGDPVEAETEEEAPAEQSADTKDEAETESK